jgi:hypothetical protein
LKRALLAILVCAASFYGVGGAMAQTDAVLEQYRAYRAALETGDLNAAEAAAEAALTASETRDGDMGNTAVLAMNLALVRLQKEEGAEAVAPAQRALQLAEARGEASGVDPALARLALRRAEFAANPDSGATPLLDAVRVYASRPEAAADVYPAAAELGLWSFRGEHYEMAGEAWAIAAGFRDQVGSFAYGRARLGQGASLIMDVLGRHGRHLDRGDADDAYEALLEASNVLEPLANEQSPDGGFTPAQLVYAESLAWRYALRAKLQSDGVIGIGESWEAEGDAADGLTETMAPAADTRPRCLVDLKPEREIEFPSRAAWRSQVGSVIVRLTLDEQGQIADTGVAAGVGSPLFVEAVEAVGDSWEVTKRDDSPPNCRMAMTVLRSVAFVMRR